MLKDRQTIQTKLEITFLNRQKAIEKTALELYKKDEEFAATFLSNYSIDQGSYVVNEWREPSFFLITKYNEGYAKDPNNSIQKRTDTYAWNRQVIKSEGKKHKIPDAKKKDRVKYF